MRENFNTKRASRLRLCLVGASGKMGNILCKMAHDDPTIKLVATLCSPRSSLLGKDVGLVYFGEKWDLFFEEMPSKRFDLVIDFSLPEGTKKALQLSHPLVCATTGLCQDILQEFETFSKKNPLLYSPNFSLGIAHLSQLLKQANKLIKGASVEVRETHHHCKKDSPSGTALKLAQILDTKQIQATRGEKTLFHHEVLFSLEDEHLILKHEAHSREVFARGALKAAKFLIEQPPGIYSMEEVINC